MHRPPKTFKFICLVSVVKVGRCDLVNSDDQMANSLATHLGHEVNQRSAAWGGKSFSM